MKYFTNQLLCAPFFKLFGTAIGTKQELPIPEKVIDISRGISGVAGKNVSAAVMAKGNHVVRLGHGARGIHARGPNRHTGYGQAGYFWAFGQQAVDVCDRYMPFNDVAIHDGSVARAQLTGDLVLVFDSLCVCRVNLGDCKSVLPEIHAPAAAAASSGWFVDADLGAVCCFNCRAAS